MIKKRKNIESRINFASGVVLIFLSLAAGAILFSFEKDRYLMKMEAERQVIEAVITRYEPFEGKMFSHKKNEEAKRVLRKIVAHEKILGACLYDSYGRLVAQDFQGRKHDFRHHDFPPDLSSIRDRNDISRSGRFAILTKPFAQERGEIAHIGAIYSVEQIEGDFANSIAVWFSAIAAAVLFLFFATRMFVEQAVTGPTRKLKEAMRSFVGGDVPPPNESRTENELEEALRWFKFICEENVRMKWELSHLNMVLDEKVKQRTKVSEEANRAKTAFLANMSHELRTPLNAILGFANIIGKKADLSEETLEQLSIIRRSGEYLLSLINEVLDLSKIEAGQMELNEAPMDLHRLLWELENMFKMKAANKKLELAFELDEKLPRYIQADELKLRQILTNLIDNAVKFTSEGGISLRAKVAERCNGKASVEADTTVCFEIEDTGVGISSREIKDLFKAFVQTSSGHRTRQGTGLGLAISHQLVKLMKGEIEVESTPDKGSKFSFTIPFSTICMD